MPFEELTRQKVKHLAGSTVIFGRGLNYCRSKTVRELCLDEATLSARVLGRNDYQVEIVDDGGELRWQCSCPYDGDCCKHVVATLLTFLNQKEAIYKQAKKIKAGRRTLRSQLLKLDKKSLVDLLIRSTRKQPDWKSTLLKAVADKLSGSRSEDDLGFLYQEQFEMAFAKACDILTEHNEYGGGPEADWEVLNNVLGQIIELSKHDRLTSETRQRFIDQMISFYDWGNSGLEDAVMDALFDVCATETDWRYLVSKLRAKPSDYKLELIMNIYKDHLGQEEKYLEMREKHLRWSGDYLDLARYWKDKGDLGQAVQIAEWGVEACGRAGDLLEFLFEYHRKTDYGAALTCLKRIYQESPSLTDYKRLKEYARTRDWPELDRWCRDYLRKTEDSSLLADIHSLNQEWDQVLSYVLSDSETLFPHDWDNSHKDELAEKLIPLYPEQLLPYYKKRAQLHIDRKDRNGYHKAADYGQRLKTIYRIHLKAIEKWDNWIESLRLQYQRHPALLDEFRKL